MSKTDYDQIAEKYAPAADDMPGNRHYEWPATIALLPPLKELTILDAGCGAGRYTEYCVNEGGKVVAFDPSFEMVEHTRQRVGDRAELFHCTTVELADLLDQRSFDLILSNLVLHYVEDLGAEFAALAPLLKPGGQMIISMKHPLIHQGSVQGNGYWWRGWLKLEWAVGTVHHYQRPLSDITDAIFRAGLLIEQLVEAKPTIDWEKAMPHQRAMGSRIPYFLHLVLRKPERPYSSVA